MADISKIEGYNLKDSTARSGLSDKMDKANPTGTGSLSINRKANTTVGQYSTAEGYNCEASGARSHAEGTGTTASDYGSHAEGGATNATAYYSHAEGYQTTANSNGAHAEGYATTAGYYSHAEGMGTIANHAAQHVFGTYNVADASTAAATAKGNYIEVVGKGMDDNARSNARTLDWNGNETLAGDLIFNGSTSLTNKFIYEKTASGSIATFSDGGNNIPMKSCEVAIVAVQAGTGTPSPSNVRAISGFDEVIIGQTVRNIFRGILYQANTYFDSTGVFTSNAYFSVYYVNIKKNETYTISLTESASSGTRVVRVGTFDSNNNLIEIASNTYSATGRHSLTFSFTSDFDHALVLLRNTTSDVQLELGSTATAYEIPQTHTITLPETIYGGTAELVGGNGTKTFGYVEFDGTETTISRLKAHTFLIRDAKLNDTPGISAEGIDAICNRFVRQYPVQYSNISNGQFLLNAATISPTQKGFVCVVDDINDTAEDFITWLTSNHVQIVYPLDTPTAFTFTGANIPTLSGVNNVYADSGDVDLEYFNENADEIAELIRVLTR